jgi:heme O synthase-like polyprenyltransferase
MWPRVIVGVVFCLVGALWIAQGVGAAKGSPMTGHPSYALLGVVVVVVGLWLVVAGARRGRSRSDQTS